MESLNTDPSAKFKDNDLRKAGMEPSQVHDGFKNHGITFCMYQRMLRINTAFKNCRKELPVTHTAFDSGFES